MKGIICIPMSGSDPVLDYSHLRNEVTNLAASYRVAEPFPHIVLDGFLSPAIIAELNSQFPDTSRAQEVVAGGEVMQRGKEWVSGDRFLPLLFRRLFWEMNFYPFVDFLENLTGIAGLLADPHHFGGGVQSIAPGGFLKLHTDFNKHPDFDLDRRVNVYIYLNENWLPEYGGALELWSKNLDQCVKSIAPLAGRCVVFSSSVNFWHGHPQPLACPPDRRRRSLALYYYTNGNPRAEDVGACETIWGTPRNY